MTATTPSLKQLDRHGQSTPALVLCELTDTGNPDLESYSPFCLKVHRALKAAGLPYARRHATRPDEFRAYNEAGQVPVLLVGDEVVADSTRILARIDQLTGAFSHGLTTRERAEALLWEEYADGALNGFLMAARWADERNWPLVRATYFAGAPAPVRAVVPGLVRRKVMKALIARDVWRAGGDACWSRFLGQLEALDARAPALNEGGFWVSRDLSVADLAIFAQLRSLCTPLTAFQAAQVALRPRLVAYLDRVDRATRTPFRSVARRPPSEAMSAFS